MIKKKKISNIFDDDNDNDNNNNIDDIYRAITFYDYNLLHLKQFNYLGKISKNIYNSSIYCIQIFNKFKNKIFKKLYFNIIKDINIDSSEFIKNKLIYYHSLYSNLNNYIKNNNNYIYKSIITELNNYNIIIKNSNINNIIEYFIWKFKTDSNIYLDNINNDLLLNDIVISMIRSKYKYNYNKIKNEMLNHKPYTIYNNEIINDIKNNNILSWSYCNKYKILISKKLNINLKSDQNYI